jgi:hypothetical protein
MYDPMFEGPKQECRDIDVGVAGPRYLTPLTSLCLLACRDPLHE